jgi:phosphatidylinositol alpha-mannosyltransferase
VQAHVRDLAEALLGLGHEVSVLTPVDDDDALPPYAVGAGRPLAVPYNGSVARLLLGPVSAARVRRWLADGHFDVLHVHEPVAPSISILACYLATGPIVGTFHTANPRSRLLHMAQGMVQPALEKLGGRIAVSEAARRTSVEHLGGDAVLVPNGVATARFATAEALPGLPDGRTLLFLGRVEEPRKGLAVLLSALADVPPPARLWVAGPGRVDVPPALADRVEVLGLVSEEHKARLLRSADVMVAPNLGQESFGIVLLEALAAGAPLVASDLDAFRRVLGDERAAVLVPPEDPTALAAALRDVLADPQRRVELARTGPLVAARYDWRRVALEVVAVYDAVIDSSPRAVVGVDAGTDAAEAAQTAAALAAAGRPRRRGLARHGRVPSPRRGGPRRPRKP